MPMASALRILAALFVVLSLCSAAPAAPAKDSAPRAAIVTIQDEINDVTLSSLKRRVELARKGGASIIVLEMNTPGGLVSSAMEICTYLKNLTDLHTVAWVKPAAYSAGAMIALSCDEVVMASASRMGDCAPIVISPTEGLQTLGQTERAKAESPILKEFLDSARRRKYDPLLCEAMVRPGREIWWVEKGPGGERRFVTKSQKESLTAEKGSAWRPVEKMEDPVTGEQTSVRQPIVDERDLLTLTQSEAVEFGFAKAIVSTDSEIKSRFHVSGDMARFTQSWSEAIADFLSSPMVRTILMMLIALGVYAEFNAPGHFVGGTVAAIALIIFLGAPYITGLADVWEIVVVAVGVLLIAAEIFFFPTFGAAAIVGILLVLGGLIASFIPAEPGPLVLPRMPGTWSGLRTGLQVVFGGLGLAAVGMWILNKYLPHLPGANRMLLVPPKPAGATTTRAGWMPVEGPAGLHLGDTGRTMTRLRPAGKAAINGRRVDVIAVGQMIDEDRLVEVIEIAGPRVVVKEIREA
ncbi:MAG TPA: hypothetical protein VMV81_06710 [Phycisphaerae bacterium]|nr:hypothetical protein [Phycisphaerae bacterium]